MRLPLSPSPIKPPPKCAPGGKRAVSGITIGTFHAICRKLLGDVRLISQTEALTQAEQVLRAAGRKGSPRALLQSVSRVKCGSSLEEAQLDQDLYDAYRDRLGGGRWAPWILTTCSRKG